MDVDKLKNFTYAIHAVGYNFVQQQLNSGEFAISEMNKTKTEVYDLAFSSGVFPTITRMKKRIHPASFIYAKSENALKVLYEQLKSDRNLKIILSSLDEFSSDIISKLTEFIAYQILLQTPFTSAYVDKISKYTLKSILNKKVTHVTKFYVEGLYINTNQVELDMDDYIFRLIKPNKENLGEYDDAFQMGTNYASIIEVEILSNDKHIAFSDKFDQYITPLQLYKLMDTPYSAQLTNSYFKTYHGRYSHGYKGFKQSNHKFVITNVKDFMDAVVIFNKKLKEQNIFNPTEGESRAYSIHISLDRYKNSLKINQKEFDRKITEIIMGLEALYLTGDEKETLGFKLKYRITQVFVQLGVPYETLLTIIGESYKIRSAFAHGSAKSTALKKSLNNVNERHGDIIDILLDLLRESLLIFLFIDTEKKLFIELINASFVCIDKREELQRLILTTRLKYSTSSTYILNTSKS